MSGIVAAIVVVTVLLRISSIDIVFSATSVIVSAEISSVGLSFASVRGDVSSVAHAVVVASWLPIASIIAVSLSGDVEMVTVSSARIHPLIASSWIPLSTASAWSAYRFSVAHTAFPSWSTFGIEVRSARMMTVSAPIFEVYAWTVVEEYIAVIVSVDGEDPCATPPKERSNEVVGLEQQVELPVEQYVSEVCESVAQIVLVEVSFGFHAEEVIKVDLIRIVILLVVEVELVCHFIGQIESLLACSPVTHSRHANYCGQHSH